LKTGNRLKNEETDEKKRKLINKLRIQNFFRKPETDPIFEETGPKKEKTDQQIKNLKLLLKTRNGPKKRGKDPNKEETD